MSLDSDVQMTRDAVSRQPGCSVPDCLACQFNREREAAIERVIALAKRADRLQRIYDAWITAGRPK